MAGTRPRPEASPRHGWIGPAIALVFAIAPAFFWSGELFSDEMAGLLRKNWATRTFLQKTFDPRGGADFYQGRELSYAIDCLDAEWTRFLMAHDRLWLVPPSGMLASLAFVPIGLWLLPRALPGLGHATRWLALFVLLSNFVVQCSMGVLFRATKPLVAPLLLALLLFVLAEYRQPRLAPRAAFAAVFSAGLALGLLDRQGLFYLLLLTLVLTVAWLCERRGSALLAGAVAACGTWLAYFHFVGAPLIHALNGYWPRMGFQRLRPAALMAREPWLQAVDLLGDWTSVLVGSLPKVMLAAVLLAGCAFWAWRERRDPRRVAFAAACALAAAAAQLTMVAMMVDRHPPVTWPGSRLWYYPLPFQAFATFVALCALEAFAGRRADARARAVPIALVALVVLNVLAWPERRATLNADPPFAEQNASSAAFVRSFRSGVADPRLGGSNRIFYFECLSRFPRLAARAGNQVGEVEGLSRSELRGGRLVAWAGNDVRLVAWTRPGGRYVLAGTAWLRSGETLSLLVRRGRPRLVGEVRREAPQDGLQRFRIVVELGSGANAIQILSSLPETNVPGSPRGTRAAYLLVLPIAVLPAPREPASTVTPMPAL